jgi:hypothetical protein
VRRPEEALQRRVVNFLRYVSPLALWFHVPNGGGRSKAEAGIMKAMGARAGVPDLIFLLPSEPWRAAIELKTDTGKLSAAQRAWRADSDALGVPFAVARSVLEVDTLLRGWGVEYLREPTGFYEQLGG